jgi:hypothetical protein
MVKSTNYKGIEYVRLASLTREEQDIFQKTFNPHLFIKILVGEEIVHDCIQYKDYVAWYLNISPSDQALHEAQPVAQPEAEVVEAN